MGAPNISKDIADYLTATVGLSNVFYEALPPTPINAYAVVTYAGKNYKTHGGGNAGGAGVAFDIAYLQIQARHSSNQTAKENIIAVVNALDGLGDVTINGVVYHYIEESSCPRLFAKQSDGSTIFIWECYVQALR